MKALNIIICLLAVTFFVACGKKKEGNSNPYMGNPYGLAPNNIQQPIYNNPGTGVMPGYQLPQSCGAGQMFPDAVSYCGWLATEGEKVCNPLLVKQMFLQYCQSFAVRYNYCVPQVQSGCYYGSGCSFGSKTIRYHVTPRERDPKEYYGSHKSTPVYTEPIKTAPTPVPVKPKCYPNADLDCKQKNPKKSELICKPPKDSTDAGNYLYSYEEYLEMVQDECSKQTVTAAPTTTVYETTETAPKVIPRGELGTVYTKPDLPHGKLGTVITDHNPLIGENKTETNTTTTAPSKPRTVYVLPEDLPKTQQATEVSKKSLASCMNLQDMHQYIINPENHLSSISIYTGGGLSTKSANKAFATKWTETIKSYASVYRGNVEGRDSNNLSGLGYDVKQTATTLKVYSNADRQSGMSNSTGQIIGCSEKQLIAKFKTPYGSETVTYNWNGSMDDDFEMIVTKNGTFKYGNQEDTYIMSNYVVVGKDLKDIARKDDQIVHKKVQADMHEKGIFEPAYKK